MIVDHISNAPLYYGLGKGFEKALRALAAYAGNAETDEDISVDEKQVFLKVRPYLTRPVSVCKFEAHKQYADIHFVVDGCEKMGYAPLSTMKIDSYSREKDTLSLTGEGNYVTLRQGDFMIAFPQDAHMPCVAVDESALCRKIIAKVKIA